MKTASRDHRSIGLVHASWRPGYVSAMQAPHWPGRGGGGFGFWTFCTPSRKKTTDRRQSNRLRQPVFQDTNFTTGWSSSLSELFHGMCQLLRASSLACVSHLPSTTQAFFSGERIASSVIRSCRLPWIPPGIPTQPATGSTQRPACAFVRLVA